MPYFQPSFYLYPPNYQQSSSVAPVYNNMFNPTQAQVQDQLTQQNAEQVQTETTLSFSSNSPSFLNHLVHWLPLLIGIGAGSSFWRKSNTWSTTR